MRAKRKPNPRGTKKRYDYRLGGFKFIIPSTEDQNENMKITRLLYILLLVTAVSAYSESISYVVKEKDTLWSISQRYNIGVDELKRINEIEDETTLRVGMTLLVPTVYIVEKGDNLWKIAREHKTSVQILRELNNIKNDQIHIGDELFVPVTIDSEPEIIERVEEQIAEDTEQPARPVETYSINSKDAPFWPVEGVRTKKIGKISGTEILGSEGDAVVSIAGGEVVWNSTSPVFGNVIIIESASNYLYLYSGLADTIVKFGDRIHAGIKIAELGKNPHTGEAKLLFSVYKDGQLIDPSRAPRG